MYLSALAFSISFGLFVLVRPSASAIVLLGVSRLRANYFRRILLRRVSWLSALAPRSHTAGLVVKNLLGVLLIAIGHRALLPCVPGQGILTILSHHHPDRFPGGARCSAGSWARKLSIAR